MTCWRWKQTHNGAASLRSPSRTTSSAGAHRPAQRRSPQSAIANISPDDPKSIKGWGRAVRARAATFERRPVIASFCATGRNSPIADIAPRCACRTSPAPSPALRRPKRNDLPNAVQPGQLGPRPSVAKPPGIVGIRCPRNLATAEDKIGRCDDVGTVPVHPHEKH